MNYLLIKINVIDPVVIIIRKYRPKIFNLILLLIQVSQYLIDHPFYNYTIVVKIGNIIAIIKFTLIFVGVFKIIQ